MIEVTEDRFLGGRVIAVQPKRGFRAGHDTVLLAAGVPAKAGDRVLELGSGAGIASLCLAARVPGVSIAGFELDADLVLLANANAERNAVHARVTFVQGDALTSDPPLGGGSKFAQQISGRGHSQGSQTPLPESLSALRASKLSTLPQGEGGWDHVFFNPPFHPDTGQVSPSSERDRATRGNVRAWMDRALELVAAGGTVTAIIRADRLDEIDAGAWSLTVLPLLPRIGEPPKRVIVCARPGASGTQTLPGFALHEPDGRPTLEAESVLRHAAAIAME